MSIRIFTKDETPSGDHNEMKQKQGIHKNPVLQLLEKSATMNGVKITKLAPAGVIELTHHERELMSIACNRADEQKIIILHEASTMIETARVLAEKVLDKTVVLCQAFLNHSVSNPDNAFNIGCALAYVQTMPAGVYIVTHGMCVPWNKISLKDTSRIFPAEYSVN
jgi:L-asparaginase